MVVFCTTYALILPAITLEKNTPCSLQEHAHTVECYEKKAFHEELQLTCNYETLSIHVHTDACRSGGELTCGTADYVAHEHTAACWEGTKTCVLPEIKLHTHTQEECYEAKYPEIHTHTDSCYTRERGELTCLLTEGEGHVHDPDGCYTLSETPVCGLEETQGHTHSEECSEKKLTCQLVVESHTHTDGCYTQLVCDLPEDETHTHSDECSGKKLVCELTEQPHNHIDSCYETILVCTQEEAAAHAHSRQCYNPQLKCDLTEQEAHTHSDACYAWTETVVCGMEEGQGIGEPTYVLKCEKPEVKLHAHGDGCYETYTDEDGNEHTRLICKELALSAHVHSDTCFTTVQIPAEDANTLTCGQQETQGHTHGENCYGEGNVLTCDQEEMSGHSHSDLCYGTWVLKCTLPVHTHSRDCSPMFGLTDLEKAQVTEVISLIDKLPTYEEMAAKLQTYEDTGDTALYQEYIIRITGDGQTAYSLYNALTEDQKACVHNLDRLMDLSSVWSVTTLEWNEQAVNVYARNSIGTRTDRPILFYGDSGGVDNPGAWVGGNTAPGNWRAIQVRESKTTGKLYVYYISGEAGFDHFKTWSNQYADFDGDGVKEAFMLLVPTAYFNSNIPDVEVGDQVTVVVRDDFLNSGATAGVYEYNHRLATDANSTGVATGLWNIYFGATQKTPKDNSSELRIVSGANTYDLITLNLFDYNSNINNRYNQNNKYLGFQQDEGTKSIGNSFGALSFNFGNNITADLDAGHSDVTSTSAPGIINRVTSAGGSALADVPISGAVEPLLQNRYPVIADFGASADIYFNKIGAAYGVTQMNTDNINGLFRYNATTGEYSYDSRENHAQFNASTNTFTLYEQELSPNFIMYPFGNFMPLNDIVHDCVRSDRSDRDYILEIANSARWKSENGYRSEYGTLATVLYKYVDGMDTLYNSREWTAGNMVQQYFSLAYPDDPNETPGNLNALLPQIYTLDYDTPSNFFFGMNMRMDFMQPRNGMTGTNNAYPMIFEFAGDDDVWVYIDGVLFLELSGIHRHVGGTIDFVNGTVSYYAFDSYIDGKIKTQPYKTLTFAQILSAAGKSTDVLNSQGTFKDYSTHTFDFFYTERGSGSSICCINFNFPLLKQNSISVAKELSVDDPSKEQLLGNPDFRFQVLQADSAGNKTNGLFIGAGVTYNIYNALTNEKVGEGITDANGVFALKAGQRAEFTGIAENAGKYYVRELLDADYYAQYGSVRVEGSAATVNNSVTVGQQTFVGLDSPVKNASDGTTVFTFNNQVAFSKLGSLSVSKVLSGTADDRSFAMNVQLGGEPVPVGTAYTLTNASGTTEKTVETAGIIPLKAGEKATISGILAGTAFQISEDSASASGYVVGYSQTNAVDATVSHSGVAGTVLVDTDVGVVVTNSLNAAGVTVSGSKMLTNGTLAPGTAHSYSFSLKCTGASDSNGNALSQFVDYTDTKTVTVTGNQKTGFAFEMSYTDADFQEGTAFPVILTYEIREDVPDTEHSTHDATVYTATVQVTKNPESGAIGAGVTSLKKGGASAASADFVNTLLGNLTVEKKVEGGSLSQNVGEFSFEVGLMDANHSPIRNTAFTVSVDGETRTVNTGTTGTIQLENLRHNSVAVIYGVPVGSQWTITELGAENYLIRWEHNTGAGEGAVAGGNLHPDGSHVIFTNTSTYVLPETGGGGTTSYTMAGLALICIGAVYLLYIQAPRRRRDASSP